MLNDMSEGMDKKRVSQTLVNMTKAIELKLGSQYEEFYDMNMVFKNDMVFHKKR